MGAIPKKARGPGLAVLGLIALMPPLGCGQTRGAPTGSAALPAALPAGSYEADEEDRIELNAADAAEARAGLLKRTRVLERPPVPIERVDFRRELGEEAPLPDVVACKFHLDEPHGRSAKFQCVLPGGEVLKVKYGKNAEIAGEVAATRLLIALGFGADRMAVVRRLRCFGCPREPFLVTHALFLTRVAEFFKRHVDYRGYVDFDWVAVERRSGGTPIVAPDRRGWTWEELDLVDERSGGASRAEVDALRLVAVFLAHWDNKSENQRLECRHRGGGEAAHGCATPYAIVQDVGSTFGPKKVNLQAWRSRPIWADREGCRVSMKDLPYDGGTFPDVVPSEGGRRLLSGLLGRLSRRQVEELFTGARFGEIAERFETPRPVGDWADAFEAKVREMEARRCP